MNHDISLPGNIGASFDRGRALARGASLILALAASAAGCTAHLASDDEPGPAPASAQEPLITTAGATNRPSFSWVPANPGPAQLYVNNVSGNDVNSGAQGSPLKTIAKAVSKASPGNTIYVQETGTPYREYVSLDAALQSTAPISIVGIPQAGSTKLPVWQAPDDQDKPLLRFRGQHWIVRGFDFDKTGRLSPRAVVFDQVSQHNALLHSLVHGNYGHAIIIDGQDALAYKNKSYDNVRAPGANGDADAHGFRVGPGARRVVVARNEAYGNSGDGIQCAGRDTGAAPELDPEDIFLEDNRLHDNVENAIDIKSCGRVTIAGTDEFDENKLFGYTPAPNAPNGVALVIHYHARDVLVEKTRIWNSGVGITVGTAEGSLHNVQNVVIRRNVIFNLHQTDGAKGTGIRVGKVGGGTDIYNNTIDNAPGAGIEIGVMSYTGSTTNASQNTHVWNNILRSAGGHAIKVTKAYSPGFTSNYNVFFDTTGPVKFAIDGSNKSFSQWKMPVSSGGIDQDKVVSAEVDPQFVPDPLSNDYYTVAGSYARDKADPSPGSPPVCNGLPDIGFLESCD